MAALLGCSLQCSWCPCSCCRHAPRWAPSDGASERVGGGGDRVELGARVGAQALEVQLGVVLDPAHRDLEGLAIALVRLGALTPGEDVGELLVQEALDQRKVVLGSGAGLAR